MLLSVKTYKTFSETRIYVNRKFTAAARGTGRIPANFAPAFYHYITPDMAIATITISATIDSKNAGIVTFVGKAARFVTSARPIAASAAIISEKLLPLNTTAITVNGVRNDA